MDILQTLSTSPVRCIATSPWEIQKVIFNSIYTWLLTLSQRWAYLQLIELLKKEGGRFLEHSLYQADIHGLPVHQSVRRCMDHHHIPDIRALLMFTCSYNSILKHFIRGIELTTTCTRFMGLTSVRNKKNVFLVCRGVKKSVNNPLKPWINKNGRLYCSKGT